MLTVSMKATSQTRQNECFMYPGTVNIFMFNVFVNSDYADQAKCVFNISVYSDYMNQAKIGRMFLRPKKMCVSGYMEFQNRDGR